MLSVIGLAMQRFHLNASDLPLNVTVMANVLADRIARRDVARLTPSQAAVTVRGAVLAEVGENCQGGCLLLEGLLLAS